MKTVTFYPAQKLKWQSALAGFACVAMALSGCGGSDSGPAAATAPPGGTVNGSVLKGPVNAATVCVYKLDANAAGKKGALLSVTGSTAINGCAVTAADGSYSFVLPAGTTGDLLVEAGGGTYCSNEALYDATAKTCAGIGGVPVPLSVAKLVTVIAAPASGNVASAVVTPLSTSAFSNMVAAGLASVISFRSQFTALVTTLGLPTSLSADTLANDPTLQGVLASFQKIAGTDPAVLNTFLSGLATGGYRYGTGGFAVTPAVTTPTIPTPPTTPTPTPTTPATPVPANASRGILGGVLATVFAGDYAFNCRAATDFYGSGPVTSFAFKINTDGTTTLNGTAWIDATNTGTIELSYLSNFATATPTGSSQYPDNLVFNRTSGGISVVAMSLKPDGSLLQASVATSSTQYNCPATGSLIQTVPATLVNVASPTFNGGIAQKIARTEVVTGCSVGGTPTLTLGANGSASLGARSFTENQISSVMDKTFDVPASNGKRYSSVIWTSGATKPFIADAGAIVFGFDDSYVTKTAGATNPDGSGSVLCFK